LLRVLLADGFAVTNASCELFHSLTGAAFTDAGVEADWLVLIDTPGSCVVSAGNAGSANATPAPRLVHALLDAVCGATAPDEIPPVVEATTSGALSVIDVSCQFAWRTMVGIKTPGASESVAALAVSVEPADEPPLPAFRIEAA
jgi:hypothetical protein